MTRLWEAIYRIVDRDEEFDGHDVSHYLQNYKPELTLRGINEALQISSFRRVASDRLQTNIEEIQKVHTTWAGFMLEMAVILRRHEMSNQV